MARVNERGKKEVDLKGKSEETANGLSFWKVEGAGNDFVLLDLRAQPQTRLAGPGIQLMLDRHRGIGADGLLLIRFVAGSVRVDFHNSDGDAADFCGNGARCAAAFLLGDTPGPIRFHLMKIPVEALRTESGIAVRVGEAEDREMPDLSRLRPRPAALVRIGTDHWIVPVGDVNSLDVSGLGQGLRHHPWPGPKGANVTFVERRRTEIRIRTYERGVEGETLSCGSGAVAAAHWALGAQKGPLPVLTHGGDVLRVWREDSQYWLEGPTRIVYHGIWPSENRTTHGNGSPTTVVRKNGS
jgi:diaminopimelate epimerase